MDSALPAQAHILKIQLFFSDSQQVALYGSPSAVEDGWVANLTAAEVFAGDCSGLLFEVPIEAEEAHQRVGFHKEFYERHVRQAPQPSWPHPPSPPLPPANPLHIDHRLTSCESRRCSSSKERGMWPQA